MTSDRIKATTSSNSSGIHLSFGQWLVLAVLSVIHLIRLLALPFAAWAARSARSDEKPAASADAPPKPVLFFYSQVAWDEVWQRPQEFALRLSLHFDVVFFGPLQLHRRFGSRHRVHYRQRVSSGEAQVMTITPWTLPGTYKIPFVHRLNQALLRWEAQLACPSDPDIVLTNSPFPDWLPDTFPTAFVAYDFIDDFIAFDWAPADATERQQCLLKQTDVLLSGTGILAEKYASETGKPCEYIPSGVNATRWMNAAEQMNDVSVPDEIRDLPHPLIGYAGSISSRINPDVINALAKHFDSGTVLMIGPVYGDVANQISGDNIVFLGAKEPADLPALVCQFDVALIPFVMNDATRALNPIKAMEYLATGVPVISAPLPDVEKEFSGVVELATTPDEFIAAAEAILKWSPEQRKQRREESQQRVLERSWEAQGDAFTRSLLEAFEEHRQQSSQKSVGTDFSQQPANRSQTQTA
jgi:glycosyltransferase involved in cell wall biosynthesis